MVLDADGVPKILTGVEETLEEIYKKADALFEDMHPSLKDKIGLKSIFRASFVMAISDLAIKKIKEEHAGAYPTSRSEDSNW